MWLRSPRFEGFRRTLGRLSEAEEFGDIIVKVGAEQSGGAFSM